MFHYYKKFISLLISIKKPESSSSFLFKMKNYLTRSICNTSISVGL
ncbi:hypothetical protein J560_0682, partial [Acinetobacter baumannii 855125]